MTDSTNISQDQEPREPIRVSRETVEFRLRTYGPRDWSKPEPTIRHEIEYRLMSQHETAHTRTPKLIAEEVEVYVDGRLAGTIEQDECRSERYSTSPIADILGYPVRWLAGIREQWVADAELARIIEARGELDYRGRPHTVRRSTGYSEHNSRRSAVADLMGYDNSPKLISKKQLAEEVAAADAA
jgi:hypothetical protein